MQRSESQHPKCHKYENYKYKEFLKYTKTKTNYAINIFKSKYKYVWKLKTWPWSVQDKSSNIILL